MFNILKPGGCMYRVVPTERAIAATQNIYSRSKVPPLIAANLEKGGNGIVTEGTLVGAPMEIAATDDIGMATKMAHACAAEASAVGANWAFAPIIDIDTNYRNPITNTRTFGSDPERVRRMGRAYVEEVQKMGLAASIKHFPGDGQDERDQHLVTSINSMDCDPWMNTYGAAYKAGIEAGALTAMVGHIMQPAWTRRLNPGIKDEDIMPGTLSREMMQGLLRGGTGLQRPDLHRCHHDGGLHPGHEPPPRCARKHCPRCRYVPVCPQPGRRLWLYAAGHQGWHHHPPNAWMKL